jgi:hypothetical protein
MSVGSSPLMTPHNHAAAPQASIIVASHRASYVEPLARELQAAVSMDPSVEAIIVADYPIGEVARTFPGITWVYLPEISISAKRNHGIRLARGTIIGFIDDDCRPFDGWISAGRSYLANHAGVSAVEGQTRIEPANVHDGVYREFKRLERPGFRTNNIFYRAAPLRAAGGFDERFTVQREDLDLAFTVIEAGGSIGYSDSIRVEHRFRPDEPWDLLKNCWNRRFDPLLHKKHRDLYRLHVKTPWTPSIVLLLAAHCATLALAVAGSSAALAVLAADAVLSLGIAVKKNGGAVHDPGGFLRAWVSNAAAPFVLAVALVHGNLRFGGRLLG